MIIFSTEENERNNKMGLRYVCS